MAAPARDLRPVFAFAAALVIYIALGVTVKSVVLNWIVGPLFPVVVLYAVPAALRRARRRR